MEMRRIKVDDRASSSDATRMEAQTNRRLPSRQLDLSSRSISTTIHYLDSRTTHIYIQSYTYIVLARCRMSCGWPSERQIVIITDDKSSFPLSAVPTFSRCILGSHLGSRKQMCGILLLSITLCHYNAGS
jgi:hypothetical protein